MKKFSIGAVVLILAGVALVLLLGDIHDHERVRRIRDLANLQQIGQACEKFARDNAGHFPEDWSQLDAYVAGNSNLFVRSENRHTVGSMTNVMDWTDYVYAHRVTTASPRRSVVAFLPPGSYPKNNGHGCTLR